MQTRHKDSLKHADFPSEYCLQIRLVCQSYFASKLPKVRWIVQGRIYAKEIGLLVGFISEKGLRQKNILLSIDFNPQKDKCKEKIEQCMDLLADILEHHLKGPWPNSLQWQKASLRRGREGGREEKSPVLYFQSSTVHTELEAQADRLLADREAFTLSAGK